MVLYPSAPKSLGRRPSFIAPAKVVRTARASSNLRVVRSRPASDIMASLPQSLNQWYPAMMLFPSPLRTRNWSAPAARSLNRGSRLLFPARRPILSTSIAIRSSTPSGESRSMDATMLKARWPSTWTSNRPGEKASSLQRRPLRLSTSYSRLLYQSPSLT